MGRLDGKVAIVTGAGVGIGRATAELFSAEGASVVLMGRREKPLVNTADLIRERGGKVRVAAGDVTRASDCEEAVRVARDAFGTPTVLVNNAGAFEGRHRVHEISPEDFQRNVDVNLLGPFLMTRAVIPGMLETGGGSIVNVGSILAQFAIPNAGAYNASKGGLLMLTRSTAIDYAADGIRCNMVSPGLVETTMTEGVWRNPEVRRVALRDYPMDRFGQPEDLAPAILHFASDESSWTTGAVLTVDGGATAH